jgi:hypothetical protein
MFAQGPTWREGTLDRDVRSELEGIPRYSSALGHIRELIPSAIVVGGVVRDLLLGNLSSASDLDIVVDSRDRVPAHLLHRHFHNGRNRHGNWRLTERRGGLQVDIWSPGRFFGGFRNAANMLEHFDFSVNAIGIRLDNGGILDPVDGMADIGHRQVTLLEKRWKKSRSVESGVLCLRLLKLLQRYPGLTVRNSGLAHDALQYVDRVPEHLACKYVAMPAAAAATMLSSMLTGSQAGCPPHATRDPIRVVSPMS